MDLVDINFNVSCLLHPYYLRNYMVVDKLRYDIFNNMRNNILRSWNINEKLPNEAMSIKDMILKALLVYPILDSKNYHNKSEIFLNACKLNYIHPLNLLGIRITYTEEEIMGKKYYSIKDELKNLEYKWDLNDDEVYRILWICYKYKRWREAALLSYLYCPDEDVFNWYNGIMNIHYTKNFQLYKVVYGDINITDIFEINVFDIYEIIEIVVISVSISSDPCDNVWNIFDGLLGNINEEYIEGDSAEWLKFIGNLLYQKTGKQYIESLLEKYHMLDYKVNDIVLDMDSRIANRIIIEYPHIFN